jgi:hypothetical protein
VRVADAARAALLGDLSSLAAPSIIERDATGPAELDRRWSQSGAAALTGWPSRPLLAPPDLTARLQRIGDWIADLGGVEIDPLATLTSRAALAGYHGGGEISCGGSTRLLRCANGWLAVTLARPEDVDSVPAWLAPSDATGWEGIAHVVRCREAGELAARARLLGLAVAPLGSVQRRDGPATRARRVGRARASRAEGMLVVDLSSLWAGPLCARVLQAAGARIVKVESEGRPDGARAHPAFFDALHRGQESVAIDFGSSAGRADLRALLEAADVVIESSRPRALQQLGIDAGEILGRGRPRLWISITGYGADGEAANWVAFGDDAAAAGGLVAWDDGRPCFCADAVADPATGLVAAAAAFVALRSGRWTIDVALARVASALAADRNGWRVDPAAGALRPRAGSETTVPTPRAGRDRPSLSPR